MKRFLLMLLGVMLIAINAKSAAPNSYIDFGANGTLKSVLFGKFSEAVPGSYNLGMVYPSTYGGTEPNIGVKGYRVVISGYREGSGYYEREGGEYETSHYMLVYIGVYDKNIQNIGEAYFDPVEKGLYIRPIGAAGPVAFGHQFQGGTGAPQSLGDLEANQFIWSDGMVDNFVLPKPLVYDELTGTYRTGEYQIGHSYCIAIHFTEMANWTIPDAGSGVNPWEYPMMTLGEYRSWNRENHYEECLLAHFAFADFGESATSASIIMSVNGERQQYDLRGEGQEPIDLGTVYNTTRGTVTFPEEIQTLPDLGFSSFTLASAAPYTQSSAAGTWGASMTFTTYKKGSEADQKIGEGFKVRWNDYKTADFGGYPAILCATNEGLGLLAEGWAYTCAPLDVWADWYYSFTHPVMAGWPIGNNFEDGETYTIALYFSEFSGTGPACIHRNGGKYYKFNFTYKDIPTGISTIQTDQPKGKDTIYTIDGRPVQQPTKGFYIINGKKTFLK